MACSRITYCPICRQPLSAEEIAGSPEGDYPTHYACRVAMQEAEETLDDESQEREYRDEEEGEGDES